MLKPRLVLLVAGITAVTACSGTPEPQLRIMNQAPAELPPWVNQPAGLPVNDLVHVANVDHLNVFASRDDGGQWCVVLAIEPTSDGSDWVASASCAPSERFAAEGVWVEAASSARTGGALLLPVKSSGVVYDVFVIRRCRVRR